MAPSDADATTKRGCPCTGWVGANDTSGNTNPVTWSDEVVESGYNAYLGAGFPTPVKPGLVGPVTTTMICRTS